MHLEFNMGRDNGVARKQLQLQLKIEGTCDKTIRKPIEIKEQLHPRTKKTLGRPGKKTVAL
jgi:hypothetical protein